MYADSRAVQISWLKCRILGAQTVDEINSLWAEVEQLRCSSNASITPTPMVAPIVPAPIAPAPMVFLQSTMPPAPTTPASFKKDGDISRSTSSGSLNTLESLSESPSEAYGTPPSSTCSAESRSDRAISDCLPVRVRNTFIELERERSPSLDGFYIERLVRSCPSSRKCSIDESDDSEQLPGTVPVLPFLSLDAALEAHTGNGDVPSIGSINHGNGECRPCAFFYTKGCKSAKDCKFCHICTPLGRKAKQALIKQKRLSASGQLVPQ